MTASKRIIYAAIVLQSLGTASCRNSRNAASVASCRFSPDDRSKQRALVINSLTCKQQSFIKVNTPAGKQGTVTAATDTATKTSSSSRSLRLTLLVLMVLQNSATVLVGRHTRNRQSKDDLFEIGSFIIACELLKLVLSCVFEYINSGGHLLQSIRDNIFTSRESVLILVPSLLYLVQNSLLHVALSNLSAPVFQVTYQFKLVTTALASVLFLNRKYSPKQWICLVSLGVGVATVVLGERVTVVKEAVTSDSTMPDNPHVQSMVLGLAAVCTACISSALASVSLEKMLKGTSSSTSKQSSKGTRMNADAGEKPKPKPSLWLRNIELAFVSLCIATVRRLRSTHLSGVNDSKPFLHGFTGWVYVLLGLQAGGGLLVAAVMKYADNVLKGLATGVSVIVSSAGSAALFGTPINTFFTVGATTILISVYLFTNKVPWAKR